ncbi:MAG: enoyl-CoA hydratase-related protein [bacterium]
MNDQRIKSWIENEVCIIELNRPDKLNALTDAMYGTLYELVKKADQKEEIKVLLIQSSSTHFCAGNDLKDFLGAKFNIDSHVVKFLMAIAAFSKPIVAAVGGAAVGIGTTMLLHCDIVYCSEDTKFSLPFIKLGLTPEGGSSVLLAQRCGQAKANEWLLSGRNILADEATQSGLVNHSFENVELAKKEAMKSARALAKNSLASLVETKNLLKGDQVAHVQEVMKKEAMVFADQLTTPEAQAAFAQFLGHK